MSAAAVLTHCPYCSLQCGMSLTSEDDALTAPLMRARRDGPLLPVSWDTALDRAAAVFRSLIARYGPDSVGFYISGQCLTEEYYVVNKLMKGFIGSNNIDSNSRLCMSTAVAAHKLALGEDSVPVTYAEAFTYIGCTVITIACLVMVTRWRATANSAAATPAPATASATA